MSNVFLYEKKGKIAVITYNRPEVFNVYNLDVLKGAERIWCNFRNDPDFWVAIWGTQRRRATSESLGNGRAAWPA